MPRRVACFLTLAVALLSLHCGPEPKTGIEEQAFAGPLELKLYDQLGPRAKVTATLAHGEPVEIIDQRRVFVKVRSARGEEGWTYRRNLLTPQEIKRLEDLAAWAAQRHSQGEAIVFAPLNVHSDPYRWATSFYQIGSEERVDVIAHVVTPRVGSREELERYRPRRTPPPSEDETAAGQEGARPEEISPPSPPPPPPVPLNWEALYPRAGAPGPTASTPMDASTPSSSPSPPLDDWTLVRLKTGRAGWVLTSRLALAIPDEVAQYAAGDRITSYFSLGEVRDGEAVKHHWLWTTISQPRQPFQFDSFRVFIYSRQRHRYETAYIERNVRGYYPVETLTLPPEKNRPDPAPAFSLLLEAPGGRLLKKTYLFQGYRVRLVRQEPADAPFADAPWRKEMITAPAVIKPRAKPSRLARWLEEIQRWWSLLSASS